MEIRDYELMGRTVKPLEWTAKKGRKWEAATPLILYGVREVEGMFSLTINDYSVQGLCGTLSDAKAFCRDDFLARVFNSMSEEALGVLRTAFSDEPEIPSLS